MKDIIFHKGTSMPFPYSREARRLESDTGHIPPVRKTTSTEFHGETRLKFNYCAIKNVKRQTARGLFEALSRRDIIRR